MKKQAGGGQRTGRQAADDDVDHADLAGRADLADLAGSDDSARVARLDNRLWVLAMLVAALVLFLLGILRSPYGYGDPRFVVGYLGTELQVAALFTLATLALWPARQIGLRRPRKAPWHQVLPLLLLVLATLGAWGAARASLPAGVALDNGLSWRVLRTTLLVGFNEEWLFRGLLLAAFCRWWGLRRGAFAALLTFALFHLLNLAAGVPPWLSAVQITSTVLLGSIFTVAAVGTRSLWWPMLVHGLYNFAVIDMGLLASAGASQLPTLATSASGLLLGLWCLFQMSRWHGGALDGLDTPDAPALSSRTSPATG